MMTKEGSFYSALDADSEGEEGKFYVWSREELSETLGEDFKFTETYYALNQKGSWEGNFILLRDKTDEEVAKKLNLSIQELEEKAQEINSKLLKKRETRLRPGLDDKSLTSWNALMTVGFLDAYQAFNEPLFLKAALNNLSWIKKKQTNEDGSLYHSYKNGQSSITGFLEDYCFTIEAYIHAYEATFDENHLQQAKQLADYAILHFRDEQSGMFFFSSDKSGELIARKMEINDNVIPSSNSEMARALYDLGILLDNKEYKIIAKQMLSNVYADMSEYGSSYSNWAILALHLTRPYYEIAVTGANFKEKVRELNQYYIPNKLLLGAEKESNLALLEGKFLGDTKLFVCIEGACKLPTNTVQEAMKQMNN
jgi:hypothetical protein